MTDHFFSQSISHPTQAIKSLERHAITQSLFTPGLVVNKTRHDLKKKKGGGEWNYLEVIFQLFVVTAQIFD